MTKPRAPVFSNVLAVSVNPPLFLDNVAPMIYVGPDNDFVWERFLPGARTPDVLPGCVTEERGGREVMVFVDTTPEPLIAWAGKVAAAYPVLVVFLRVGDAIPHRWANGEPVLSG